MPTILEIMTEYITESDLEGSLTEVQLQAWANQMDDQFNLTDVHQGTSLSFDTLRQVNSARCRAWEKGEQWDPRDRFNEFMEEIGEFCGANKRLLRIRNNMKGAHPDNSELIRANRREEAGDIMITLDLWMMSLGIDLAQCTVDKFNKTSEKHGFPHRLAMGEPVQNEIIDIVFDGPPSHESGRFVETENLEGASINAGQWIDRKDGYWALRIQVGILETVEPERDIPYDVLRRLYDHTVHMRATAVVDDEFPEAMHRVDNCLHLIRRTYFNNSKED